MGVMKMGCYGDHHMVITRSSWLNCALRDDETVYWVSIGHFEAVSVGRVKIGKVYIW